MEVKEIVNILIVEDKPDLRDWLSTLMLESFPDARVQCRENLAMGLLCIEQSSFQVALIDLGLPDGSGIELIRTLREQQPKCFSIVMTIFDDSEHLFQALKAGAYGYLLKDEDDQDLLLAFKGIIDGKPPISPKVAQMMIEYFHSAKRSTVSLTERETEVLTLIAKGFSVKKTADLLDMSRHTVSDHVKQIYRKLNINSRAEASLKAVHLGLLDSSSI